jgi:hypothetical protein
MFDYEVQENGKLTPPINKMLTCHNVTKSYRVEGEISGLHLDPSIALSRRLPRTHTREPQWPQGGLGEGHEAWTGCGHCAVVLCAVLPTLQCLWATANECMLRYSLCLLGHGEERSP